MKTTHHIGTVLLMAASACVLSSCASGDADRHEEALLDSARVLTTVHMDYRQAGQLCLEVRDGTRNKLHRLAADVGLMKLCQICSEGKRFYDYRSDAERLMGEMAVAPGLADSRADSLRQRVEAEFNQATGMYYFNLRDYAQAFSHCPELRTPGRERRHFTGRYLGEQSLYFRSLLKKWAADSLTEAGLYNQALDSLAAALHLVNEHHRKYAFTGLADTLYIYNSVQDTLSAEMRWIQAADLSAVPEWMASVREQLSITLGAMGRKAESDYNHNIYFDILDATRLDMQGEQRLDQLLRHERRLNLLLAGVAAAVVITIVLTLATYRRRRLTTRKKTSSLRSEIEERIAGLSDYWHQHSRGCIAQVEDQMEYADDNRRAAEMEMEHNKRSYVDKATAVAIAGGIVPFLDRAIHEVKKEHPDADYLAELIEKINEYNEVLGHWVKIRQGAVSLVVENFPLADVFRVVEGAAHLFESAGLSLNVVDTQCSVKADKALTLFMINTLMDNARKFTPRGGSVTVSASEGEDYVEVSVSDTGYGMSDNDTRQVVQAQKGHGFGLMNCRGIIEKYRKSGRRFSMCEFGVESRLGEGSRFYFRLPKAAQPRPNGTTAAPSGIMGGALSLLFMLAPSMLRAADMPAARPYLDRARQMADSVFYCNTQGDYGRAVDYGDSVVTALNRDYIASTGRTDHLLLIEGEPDDMPEVRLWEEGFQTDYGIIVDVRNELAIAALSLNRRHLYRYNSNVFTRMYQLLAQDETQAERIRRLEHSNANRGLVVNMTMLLLLLFVALTFMLYYHRHLLPLFNLRQVARLNDSLPSLPRSELLPRLHDGIADIVAVDDVCVATPDPDTHQLLFSHSRPQPPTLGDSTGHDASLEQFMNYSYMGGQQIRDLAVGIVSLPLHADTDGGSQPVGVLGIRLRSARLADSDFEMLGWVARSLALYIYYTDTRLEELHHQLELKQDEACRAEAERNRIHVQNMILDNCLSTIKHETMYYPNRIADLLSRSRIDEDSTVRRDVAELMRYYKDVFSVLYQCAMKQLERPVFRRRPIPLGQLADYAAERAAHYQAATHSGLQFSIDLPPALGRRCVLGDTVMLQYMLDTLIGSAYSAQGEGQLRLELGTAGAFCSFALTDSRLRWSAEQMSTLFYADSMQYDESADRLIGAEYLLCKQIVREHDEHGGLRGCRIYATGGNTIVFTIPLRHNLTGPTP
jgi:signal transduction histidine kinase